MSTEATSKLMAAEVEYLLSRGWTCYVRQAVINRTTGDIRL